jgi:hypothetical protein
MSAAGSFFYFLALTLGLIYAILLICYPKFPLRPPDSVWLSEEKWVREIGIFYAAVILGLVVNGLILYFAADPKTIKIVTGPSIFLTIGVSLISDIRWRSKWGIPLDITILACTSLSILLG